MSKPASHRQALSEWLERQSERDRRAIALLTLFLTGFVIYIGVLPLLIDHRRAAETSYADASKTLALLQAYQSTAHAHGSDAAPLQETLATVAKKYDIPTDGMSVDADKQVTLSENKVPFDKLLLLIDELVQQHGIIVTKLSIVREDSGYVTASLVFQRL